MVHDIDNKYYEKINQSISVLLRLVVLDSSQIHMD